MRPDGRMRICHASAGYWPFVGGAQTYLQVISERFAAEGHEVAMIATTAAQGDCFWNPRAPQARPGAERRNGVAVQRCGIGYLPAAPWSFYLLRRLAYTLSALPGGAPVLDQLAPWMPRVPGFLPALESLAPRPDVVHAVNISLEWPLIAACRYARRHQIPLVTTPFVHIGQPEVQRNYTMRHQLAALASSDAIVVQTDLERAELIRLGLPAERTVRVGMGVDLRELQGGDGARFRADHGVEGPLVTFMGTLTYDKGAIHLCEAMRRLWAGGLQVTLILAGTPVLAGQFSTYFEALPDSDRAHIRLPGQVTGQIKQDLLAATDVFVMPSRVDSFGIVYLEAWAYGKPVIGARAGGVPAVIDDGRNGLLVRFADVQGLAAGIKQLLDDPDRAEVMGQCGREVVRERYTWDLVFRKTELIYQIVTGQAEGPLSRAEQVRSR